MNIQQYITNDLDMPEVSARIGEIQLLLNQLTYSHVPIQKEGAYIGCLSKNDIHSFDEEKTAEEYQYALEGFFARDTDNWLDVLHAFAKNESNILPVLDEENHYIGYVELHDIMNVFTEGPFLNSPGGILIIQKGYNDYSFSEISQIVESNGTHLLGAFVSRVENDVAEITLKTGPTPVNALLQSFRRYGYKVASLHQEDMLSSDLKDRSRYLDKYLNI